TPQMTALEQLLAAMPKVTPTVLGIQQEAAKTIAASLPKLDSSGLLKTPQMTALEQLLAAMPKVTPTVLGIQQEAAKTIASLRSAPSSHTDESPHDEADDDETSETTDTHEGESAD
ncbi:hypothetical protein, partial [Streptomyces sp. NPDC047525]|uniref:hypothetical protein n=1 Tax=Streptomyces sp. NPDC047525 TaxID=3155264 RepID=UPI003405CABA